MSHTLAVIGISREGFSLTATHNSKLARYCTFPVNAMVISVGGLALDALTVERKARGKYKVSYSIYMKIEDYK